MRNRFRRTMKIGHGVLATVAMLFAFVAADAVLAATPGEINFQGLLLDSGGQVVNGSVDLDFELFDAATDGTSLWSESQSGVSVLDGVYDVALGSVTPIGASVLASGNVWLEITVEGETLAPRQRLLAVPYALRSAEADTAGNLPPGTLEAIYATFPFDGANPPNDDPSEGGGDTDNDGILNFIDPDNDNDGLSDGTELQQGSDINLPTPTITNATPPIASDIFPTPVTVMGTNFVAGQSVQVGPQSPVPSNITPTSFDILLDAQPAPVSTTITVTRPNGEQVSAPYGFELTLPSISTLTPLLLPFNPLDPVPLDVVGNNFIGPLTVTLGGIPATPTSVTPTSFSITVDAPPSGVLVPLSVTLSNGQNATKSFTFSLVAPDITGFFPTAVDISEATTIDVTGTNFLGAFTVTFAGNPVVPTDVTTTSFSIDVVAPAVAGPVPIVVTLSNGESDSEFITIVDVRTVFATSTVYDGSQIGGLAGADAICMAHAAVAGLSGTFRAWLADSTGSPATRFTPSPEPYRLVGGTVVANDYSDLTDGTLQNPISLDEFGNSVITGVYIWTNVAANGSVDGASDCSDWSSTTGTGAAGIFNQTNSSWTSSIDRNCTTTHPVYCFEQ